jgi:hypothetical protein
VAAGEIFQERRISCSAMGGIRLILQGRDGCSLFLASYDAAKLDPRT